MHTIYPFCESVEYGRAIIETMIDHRISNHEGAISENLAHRMLERNWVKLPNAMKN
jgi:hypothetical protein